jgi:YVTN family beta-propeller protein
MAARMLRAVSLGGSVLGGGGIRVAVAAGCAAGALAAAAPARAASAYTAYVANYGAGTLTPIDTATNATSPTIAVASPQAIAITPDGRTAYVCNWGAGTVTPIDLATNTAGAPITVGTNPSAIAITPDGTRAYVSNYNNNEAGTVTEINLSGDATSTIPVGRGPYGIAITPDGTTVYVANHYDGTVTPITVASDSAGTPISVGSGGDVARTDWIAMAPDGTTAYAANYGSDSIVPIAVATDTAGTPISGIPTPNSITISPDGGTAYITEDGTPGHVVAMTLSNDSLGAPITVGDNPYDLAITPDQVTAYVANYNSDGSGMVTPIDLANATTEANIAVGTGPDALAITPDQAPVASFTVTPAEAGAASSFDASASSVAYGAITSYAWNFGDGATASTAAPITTHTYAAAGNYTATLTETDSAGTSETVVFTGQSVIRNGGPSARTTRSVSISPAASGGSPAPGGSSGPEGSPAQPIGSALVSALPSGSEPAPGDRTGAPVHLVITGGSVAVSPSGNAVIAIGCPASARGGCTGMVTIALAEPRARRGRAIAARCARGCRSLGSAKYQARAGQTVNIRVHIASFARKLLVRRKSLRVSVTATSLTEGHTTTIVRTITLSSRGR